VITIQAIVGETLDLQTGEESGKALLLSNGTTTRVVTVDDGVIKAVVELFAQAMATPEELPKPTKEGGPSLRKPKKESRPKDDTPVPPASVETLTGVGSI
jgi:hypothetical protein